MFYDEINGSSDALGTHCPELILVSFHRSITSCVEDIAYKPWLKFNWLPSASECHDDHDAEETWKNKMWSSGLHIPSCWTGWTGPGIPRHPAARRPRASCWKSLAKRSKELLIRIPGWDTPSTILGQEFPQAMTISIHNNYSPELPFLKTQHVHTYSSCYTMLYHVIPCYAMLYHAIPCYTMLYHSGKDLHGQLNLFSLAATSSGSPRQENASIDGRHVNVILCRLSHPSLKIPWTNHMSSWKEVDFQRSSHFRKTCSNLQDDFYMVFQCMPACKLTCRSFSMSIWIYVSLPHGLAKGKNQRTFETTYLWWCGQEGQSCQQWTTSVGILEVDSYVTWHLKTSSNTTSNGYGSIPINTIFRYF